MNSIASSSIIKAGSFFIDNSNFKFLSQEFSILIKSKSQRLSSIFFTLFVRLSVFSQFQ